jgi:hypothetical protein
MRAAFPEKGEKRLSVSNDSEAGGIGLLYIGGGGVGSSLLDFAMLARSIDLSDTVRRTPTAKTRRDAEATAENPKPF